MKRPRPCEDSHGGAIIAERRLPVTSNASPCIMSVMMQEVNTLALYEY